MSTSIRSICSNPSLFVSIAIILLVGSAAAEPDDEFPRVTIPFAYQALSVENFYFFHSQSGVPDKGNEGFTANAGFVVTGKGVVVFDALGTPSLGAAMISEIRKVTDQPITHIVVSHYHADHIYGLQAFREMTEAKIIAQESSALYADSLDASKRLKQRRESLSPWVNDDTRIIGPDITFKDEFTFEVGRYRFNLYHAGPAHAPDDTMMMVAPAGVLFSGDIIQSGRIPFLDSSQVDTTQWMNAIEKVRELKPTLLIPGHGDVSDNAMDALSFTYDYLAFVRTEMANAVENWVDFEEAYQQTDWSRYQTLPAFDASNKANAYRVYLEMEKTALSKK